MPYRKKPISPEIDNILSIWSKHETVQESSESKILFLSSLPTEKDQAAEHCSASQNKEKHVQSKRRSRRW
jgi:hypothetical protein